MLLLLRRQAALIQTYGGSRRTRNRAGRFVTSPCITNRSVHGVKVPISSEEKTDSVSKGGRRRFDSPVQKKRAQRTAREFCAASPATSHVRSARTAAAVGAAFTTHAHSFLSRRTRNARAPTSPRSIGFCAIWESISSSSLAACCLRQGAPLVPVDRRGTLDISGALFCISGLRVIWGATSKDFTLKITWKPAIAT